MIKKLIQNIWIVFLGFILFDVFQKYNQHAVGLEEVKSQIPSIEKSISVKEKKVQALEGYFSDIDNAKNRIEKVASEVEKVQQKFPSVINDSFYNRGIREFTQQLNMKKVSITSGDEVDKGFYFIKKFELSAHATYLQFLMLLEKIEGFEKLLNISDITFRELPEKQKGRFQLIEGKITIEAYRHDPGHKENRGIVDIEKDFETKEKQEKKTRKKKKGKK